MAFSARKGLLTADSRMTFENVLFNYGNGFDKDTGIFTAPVSGVYIFSYQACFVENNFVGVGIWCSDSYFLGSCAYEIKVNDSPTCETFTGTANLTVGDTVQCILLLRTGHIYERDYGLNYFNGALLKLQK